MKEKQSNNVLLVILICVAFVAIIVAGIWSTSLSKSDDPHEPEKVTNDITTLEYTLGDTFVLDGLEFAIGTANDMTWTKVTNEYSEQNGKDVVVLPVTVKNLKGESNPFNLLYVTYVPYGRYINSVSFLFESDIGYIDSINGNESVNTAFHILYDGDDKYCISFHSQDDSTVVMIYFQITMPSSETEHDQETEPATEPPEPAPPVKTYTSGKYKVGIDIPAGEYFLQTASSLFGYMSVSRDSSGDLDSIIENENFDTHHYITIQDGQYLELQNATAIPVNDMNKTFDASNLEEGMYRIGIDIPAGEYRLTTTSERGYFCVYDNSSAERQIQSNNNFESNDYITVVNGQYLLLSRCVGSIVQ